MPISRYPIITSGSGGGSGDGVERIGDTVDGNLATWSGNNADSINDGGNLSEIIDTAIDNANIPSVIDNVTSTSSTDALSANQGRLLNDAILSIDTGVTGSSSRYVTGSGNDKTIYERNTGIYLEYDRSEDQIVLWNTTANDIVFSYALRSSINADYNSAPVWREVNNNNILMIGDSASYLSGTANPFTGTINKDNDFNFDDEDLTVWFFPYFDIIQYNGSSSNDAPVLTSESIKNMMIRGFVDYNIGNNYIYTSWVGTNILSY